MFTVIASKYFSATNTDVFSGTELEFAPGNGVINIWAASDTDTSTLETTQEGHRAGVSNIIPYTDAEAKLDYDQPPTQVIVRKGDKIKAVLGGAVTEVNIFAQFVGN